MSNLKNQSIANNILFDQDGLYNIGGSASGRPANIYAQTAIFAAGSAVVTAATISSSAANPALSNLASVAINTNLLFGSDGVDSVGSAAANRPLAIYASGNIGIGLSGTQDASALFQADSTSQGVVFPRMTTSQMNAISSPITGLVVYVTDAGTPSYYYYNGTAWAAMGAGGGGGGISALTGDVTASGTGSVAATVAFVGGSSASSVNTAVSLVNGSNSANLVFASPNGSSGVASFRSLVVNDIPSLSSLYLPLGGGTLTGNLLFSSDNTQNIGAVLATRPANIYFGTSIQGVLFQGNDDSNNNSTSAPATVIRGADKSNGTGIAAGGSLTVRAGNTNTSAGGAALILSSGSTSLTPGQIQFQNGGTTKWVLSSSGHFWANTDNTVDIGASGANRPAHIYAGTQIVTANGSASTPGYGFVNTGTGVFSSAANTLDFTTSSTNSWRINSSGMFIAVTDNTNDIGASGATRPRTIYAGTSVISPIFTGGNGTAAAPAHGFTNANTGIFSSAANTLDFTTSSTNSWRINSTGMFVAVTDNNNDIGASGATRPRTIYLGTSAISPSFIATGTGGNFTLQASASATTSYTFKMPATQGAANTVLTNDGSGNGSWGVAGTGWSVTTSIISASVNPAVNQTTYLLHTASAAITLTLPTASANAYIIVKDIDGSASTNNITIAQNSTEKIEGLAASKVFSSNFVSFILVCDGTNWWIVG